MTTVTKTLAEFILERLAEDEALAVAARDADPKMPWVYEGGYTFGEMFGATIEANEPRMLPHVARQSPAHVLADLAAKRRIVVDFGMVQRKVWLADHGEQVYGIDMWRAQLAPLLRCVKALASVYSDHPEFRDEWRTAGLD